MHRILVLAALALVACPKKGTPDGAADAVRPSQVTAEGDPGAMHARLAHLTTARDRLAAGEVEGARAELQWIVDNEIVSVAPEAWAPHLTDLRDDAAAGAEAPDAITMAQAIADSARACGACHADLGSRPAFVEVEVPAAEAHMARHVWASDRMWEGLIGPDASRWGRATAVLRDEVVDTGRLYEGLSLEQAGAAARLHARVHELAEAGSHEDLGAADQASMYASFLGACADCHALLDGGPE